jgi:predicted RNA-binding Zn ribbon-like protein
MLVIDRETGSDLPVARQLRFDAGSPALNLLATLGYRGTDAPVERLTGVARLRDWLAANDLPAVPIGPAALESVRELREAGYRVLSASLAGVAPRRTDVAVLDGWAARPQPGPGLRLRAGRLEWRPAPDTLESVLGRLARELGERAVDDAADLRLCDAASCRMLYLDRSRGHRRRWCSMARCGNSAKVARHRSRAAGPSEARVGQ